MKLQNRISRRPVPSLLACALASCLALLPPVSLAQSAGATLRGQVSGASASTEITARNVATGAVRRTQAAANGNYTLIGLEPGTYTVEAGSGPAQTVQLSVASTSTLNLQAAAGTPAELATVTVVGSALPDVKTSEVGTTVSLRQIQTTPQLTRNFLEFADTVPGMVFSTDSSGKASLRGGAQNASSTNVYIDGVGQKSYVKEGGVSGQFSSVGNPFPQLAIGEYKVITSNYKAEYGQISSAAVTAATKSGTNEFHGEAYMRYTNDRARARTVGELQPGRSKVKAPPQKEYGFAVGGPIIQDRLHFFFSYEAKRFDPPATVVPGVSPLPPGALPPDVQAQFGPTSKPFEEDLYFGKLDWEVTDDDRLELTAQVRDEHQIDNIGGAGAVSHGIDTINNDKRYALRWEHSADTWFNEVLLTHEDAEYAPTPITIGNGSIYTFRAANDATIIQVGGADPKAGQIKSQKGSAIEDNLTFNSFTWYGDHTIKMGAKYKDITLHAQDAFLSNPQFFYNVDPITGASATPYRAQFVKPVTGLGSLSPVAESQDQQWGLYLQDDWIVNDHLVLNLGVRWDYEKNPTYLDFVTPPSVVAALNAQDPRAPAGQTYAQSLAKGGIDINDYISTGSNRSAFTGAWQPRLGFSYDLDADERHVIHGGVGRAYDRDLYDYLQLEVTKVALPDFSVFFRNPVTGECRGGPCFDWNPNFLNGIENLQALIPPRGGGEVNLINNNLDAPYSDQFSLGMSNRIGEWQTDATVSRILSYDGFIFTLGNRYPNGDFFQNGGQPWGNGVPGFGALIIGNSGVETRSTQFLFSAAKPYTKVSGWGASFAYTYTHAKQNRDFGDHYAFDGASIGDYPFLTSNAAAKHRIVATGSYDLPWDITLGMKVTLATPTPVNGFICQPPTQPGMGYCVPGDNTPNGFGQFGLGGGIFAYRSVDLQATKNFEITENVSAFARVDVLNLFNFRNFSSVNVGSQNGELFSSYSHTGDFTGVPRTVKVEVGVRF